MGLISPVKHLGDYNLTRSINLRYFPTVLILFLAFWFGLVTIINIAIYGYEMISLVSSDYNSAYKIWYDSILPSKRPESIPASWNCAPSVIKINEGTFIGPFNSSPWRLIKRSFHNRALQLYISGLLWSTQSKQRWRNGLFERSNTKLFSSIFNNDIWLIWGRRWGRFLFIDLKSISINLQCNTSAAQLFYLKTNRLT